MAKKRKQLSQVQSKILDVLNDHPDGISLQEIRELLPDYGDHEQLGRRLRSLRRYYIIKVVQDGRRFSYVLEGEKTQSIDDAEISTTQRARILNKFGSMCQMCGRTPAEDGIKLHIDHMIPRTWGGSSEDENLWPLCSQCNEGKKNHYASLDPELMKSVLIHDSVHQRIAEILRMNTGDWVDSDLIQFVANFNDYQLDWQKRLRELRYLGLEIKSRVRKQGKRHASQYKLVKWVPLPKDPTAAAREYERRRAEENRRKKK